MLQLSFILIILICIYLVNYYSSRDVSFRIKLWSVITWALNFGLALLVPQDVYSTLNNHKAHHLGFLYSLLYWSVYLLTWTIIPVLQEWEDAGEIQSQQRLKRSLRVNGWFYLWLLVGAVVALAIVFLLGIGREMGLIIFLKCLATMWGMLLLMVLMGYSLVQVPKTMWRNADPDTYLVYLYQKIQEMQEEVEDAKKQFKKLGAYISYVSKNTKDPQILRYCQASHEQIPSNLLPLLSSSFQRIITTTNYLQVYPISLQSSIQHNRLMKRAIALCRRQDKQLKNYVIEAVFYEDVREARNNGEKVKSLVKPLREWESKWFTHVRPVFNKAVALFIGLCSAILLISQSQVFLTQESSILGYLLLFDNKQVIRVLVFLVMLFIIYMSYYALFRLKLANLYGLYHKESDGASLMFATVNFSRIGVAIVLNFFDMVKMQKSVYQEVMQTPEMGLLGDWVLRGLPGVLWLIALCHFFNVWGIVAKKLGIQDSYSFSSHQVEEETEGGPRQNRSPVLVVQKRKELEDKRSENMLYQMQTF